MKYLLAFCFVSLLISSVSAGSKIKTPEDCLTCSSSSSRVCKNINTGESLCCEPGEDSSDCDQASAHLVCDDQINKDHSKEAAYLLCPAHDQCIQNFTAKDPTYTYNLDFDIKDSPYCNTEISVDPDLANGLEITSFSYHGASVEVNVFIKNEFNQFLSLGSLSRPQKTFFNKGESLILAARSKNGRYTF